MKLNTNNYVDIAEEVIKKLAEKKDKKGNTVGLVTTSKLRNLLAMTADIYNDAIECPTEELPERIVERIQYLRVRMAYEMGRNGNSDVKGFAEEAQLLQHLNAIQGKRKNYLLFSRYMEALVAFQKFYGGKD